MNQTKNVLALKTKLFSEQCVKYDDLSLFNNLKKYGLCR